MGVVDPWLGYALRYPFSDAGMLEQTLRIGECRLSERQVIALDAHCHRSEESIDGRKTFTGEPRPAETLQAFAPQGLQPVQVPLKSLARRAQFDAQRTVHGAFVTQGRESGMHFGGGATCPGPGRT